MWQELLPSSLIKALGGSGGAGGGAENHQSQLCTYRPSCADWAMVLTMPYSRQT